MNTYLIILCALLATTSLQAEIKPVQEKWFVYWADALFSLENKIFEKAMAHYPLTLDEIEEDGDEAVNVDDNSDAWIQAWWNGIYYSQYYRDLSRAIAAYSDAMERLGVVGRTKHLYLYLERGNLYLKGLDFEEAIQDFTHVVQSSQAHLEELQQALRGRSQAYLALGKIAAFEKDCQALESIAPLLSLEDRGKKYSVFKIDASMARDPRGPDRLTQVLFLQKKISCPEDALLSPSSRVIIKHPKFRFSRFCS